MRARLCAALATAAVSAAVLPVYATGSTPAAPRPQVTDASGDANGINDQDTGLASTSASLDGTDDAAADITSVLFRTAYKTVTTTKTIVIKVRKNKKFTKTTTKTVTTTTLVPNGFTVTMTLSAAPDSNTVYDIQATSPTCSGFIDMTYSTNAQAESNSVSCVPSSLSAPTTAIPGQATVIGKTIVFTLPVNAFPAKTALTDLFAQTYLFTLFPTLDEAYGTATYTVGS